MKRTKWEFPIYWKIDLIRKIAGGYEVTLVKSFHHPFPNLSKEASYKVWGLFIHTSSDLTTRRIMRLCQALSWQQWRPYIRWTG